MVVPAKAHVTTTTESNAIGLRSNAAEQAELGPDKPLTPAQRQELANQLIVARATALNYPTVADATIVFVEPRYAAPGPRAPMT